MLIGYRLGLRLPPSRSSPSLGRKNKMLGVQTSACAYPLPCSSPSLGRKNKILGVPTWACAIPSPAHHPPSASDGEKFNLFCFFWGEGYRLGPAPTPAPPPPPLFALPRTIHFFRGYRLGSAPTPSRLSAFRRLECRFPTLIRGTNRTLAHTRAAPPDYCIPNGFLPRTTTKN